MISQASYTPIVVIGHGNSGSGAIIDYLRGRPDVYDPLKEEFRLIQEKDGLADLEKSLTGSFDICAAAPAIEKFKNLSFRLGRRSRKITLRPRLGLGYSNSHPEYNTLIEEFLRNITEYKTKKQWTSNKLDFTLPQWVMFKLFKTSPYHNSIPVRHEKFENAAHSLIQKLFAPPNEFSSHTSIDQGGSFFSPLKSTKYYGDKRRVIVVTRDLLDVYTERQSKHGKRAKNYVAYMESLAPHIRIDEYSDPKVERVSFESFIFDHEKEKNRICAFLGLDPDTRSQFDPNLSKKNVGKHKKHLSKKDQETIKQGLSAVWPFPTTWS
ncbi:hypothetical protein LRD18_09605 [Halorhodospira halochloris]|uniref:hypothetical protein n=1 Tax=Halorhodospira halochloris TaxID=1052 RepID=UPI001EE936BC|nr:hypothetical protein [Halorhodospira halochloris]MCG5531124.1 hypothetical protein [Halorhodospira halochloris]